MTARAQQMQLLRLNHVLRLNRLPLLRSLPDNPEAAILGVNDAKKPTHRRSKPLRHGHRKLLNGGPEQIDAPANQNATPEKVALHLVPDERQKTNECAAVLNLALDGSRSNGQLVTALARLIAKQILNELSDEVKN